MRAGRPSVADRGFAAGRSWTVAATIIGALLGELIAGFGGLVTRAVAQGILGGLDYRPSLLDRVSVRGGSGPTDCVPLRASAPLR